MDVNSTIASDTVLWFYFYEFPTPTDILTQNTRPRDSNTTDSYYFHSHTATSKVSIFKTIRRTGLSKNL